jgi:chaperonin cofactor prefoldin
LHAEFAAAASRYGQAVRERRAQRPDQLKARAEQAESERTRLVRENNALRERLRHLQPELTKARPPAPGIVVSPRGPIR